MRSIGKTSVPRMTTGGLLLSLLMLAGRVSAQEQAAAVGPVVVGSRVRLLVPTLVQGRIQGTVVELDDRTLLLSTEDHRPLRVPRQSITQADMSVGRRGHALTGAIVGGAVGALFGATVPTDFGCTPEQQATGDTSCVLSRGSLIAFSIIGEAAVGALIGHLIKSERWSPVPLERVHVTLAPHPGRGARLNVSVAW